MGVYIANTWYAHDPPPSISILGFYSRFACCYDTLAPITAEQHTNLPYLTGIPKISDVTDEELMRTLKQVSAVTTRYSLSDETREGGEYSSIYTAGFWDCPVAPKADVREDRAKLLYCFAAYRLGRGWPEAEPIIAQSDYYAVAYAENVLKQRWPRVEARLRKNCVNMEPRRDPACTDSLCDSDLNSSRHYYLRVMLGKTTYDYGQNLTGDVEAEAWCGGID